jgi:hypothetical protein
VCKYSTVGNGSCVHWTRPFLIVLNYHQRFGKERVFSKKTRYTPKRAASIALVPRKGVWGGGFSWVEKALMSGELVDDRQLLLYREVTA